MDYRQDADASPVRLYHRRVKPVAGNDAPFFRHILVYAMGEAIAFNQSTPDFDYVRPNLFRDDEIQSMLSNGFFGSVAKNLLGGRIPGHDAYVAIPNYAGDWHSLKLEPKEIIVYWKGHCYRGFGVRALVVPN